MMLREKRTFGGITFCETVTVETKHTIMTFMTLIFRTFMTHLNHHLSPFNIKSVKRILKYKSGVLENKKKTFLCST